MRVLIAGAGAAGLAAGESLSRAGARVTLLEARNRIGGRVWTDHDLAGVPVELGAEFIHGERVVTWEYVRRAGLRTVHWEKRDDSFVRTESGEWLTMARAREADPGFDLTRSWDLPDVPAGPYEDLGSYLSRVGFTREQLRYVERSFANAQSESMRFLSARATLRGLELAHESGSGDYRILAGYDRLLGHLAEGLEVRLDAPVVEVEWDGDGVNVLLGTGERLLADALVVTVPLGVLQAGGIRFRPELPAHKDRALGGLRMGPVIKLVYRFEEEVAPPAVMAIYSRGNPPMWWSPSFGQGATGHGATGQKSAEQVWTAFVSGSNAVALLSLGEEGALAAGEQVLSEELGRKVEPVARRLVSWPDDPWARGGYSFVLPGHHGAREELARAVPPLFFAGEATAWEQQAATVHGAIESGRRAAAEVLEYGGGKGGGRDSDPPDLADSAR